MIDNLTEAIKEYKDFAECETETARVLRNVGNEKDAKYYEETAENDKKIVAWLTDIIVWRPLPKAPESEDNK